MLGWKASIPCITTCTHRQILRSSTGNDGGGLQRLAQAHVVGEHTVQPAAPQECQPGNARTLVRPQLPSDLQWELVLLHLVLTNSDAGAMMSVESIDLPEFAMGMVLSALSAIACIVLLGNSAAHM